MIVLRKISPVNIKTSNLLLGPRTAVASLALLCTHSAVTAVVFNLLTPRGVAWNIWKELMKYFFTFLNYGQNTTYNLQQMYSLTFIGLSRVRIKSSIKISELVRLDLEPLSTISSCKHQQPLTFDLWPLLCNSRTFWDITGSTDADKMANVDSVER